MYHSTGFTKAEITGLCARIEARELSPRMRRWPPVLGLRNALTITLAYLRRNRVPAEIAENYGVSQPTISRAISVSLVAARVAALVTTRSGGRWQIDVRRRLQRRCWRQGGWSSYLSGTIHAE